MPDRFLRETLLTSARWNDLGHAAQNFYVRLMLIVDDFGCFDGRESVVANACYPTQRVDVSELLATLHAVDLIVRYSNAGKPYIALQRWQTELRGKRRFPAPPINNDAPDLKYTGKYSRPIGWRNPGSTEPVSLLLDAQMRPVIPQPPEWRLVNKDYAPDPDGAQALNTMVTKPYEPRLTAPSTSPLPPVIGVVVVKGSVKEQSQSPTQDAPQHGTQPLQAAPTTPTNGKYQLNDAGEWAGVGEAQRLRWQSMFDDLSIPDQLARAGAWLVAHADERKLYTDRGELEQFLIRWLLREARERTGRARASTDS